MARISKAAARDERALVLREQGFSFKHISEELGFRSATEIVDAYRRAAEKRAPADRAALEEAELGRLNALAERLRDTKRLGQDRVAKRLATIEELRVLLST